MSHENLKEDCPQKPNVKDEESQQKEEPTKCSIGRHPFEFAIVLILIIITAVVLIVTTGKSGHKVKEAKFISPYFNESESIMSDDAHETTILSIVNDSMLSSLVYESTTENLVKFHEIIEEISSSMSKRPESTTTTTKPSSTSTTTTESVYKPDTEYDDDSSDEDEPKEDEPTPKFSDHPNFKIFPSECGTTNTKVRVQNGNDSKLFQHPWMVVLMMRDKVKGEENFACGASLVNNKTILTAAHCINTREGYDMLIRVGEFNLDSDEDCIVLADKSTKCADPIQTFSPTSYTTIVHPKYSISEGFNDLAMIKLKTPVTFSETVRPLCLPFGDENVPDQIEVIGYGLKIVNQKASSILQSGVINRVDQQSCFDDYRKLVPPKNVTDDQFCGNQKIERQMRSRKLKTSVDTCKGDSGSPALWPSLHAKQTLFGIVSYGENALCGFIKAPGVYVKVHSYLKWILDNV